MIRTSTIILFLLTLILSLSSCKTKETKNKEMLKAEKIAFFTEKLNLTAAESELFWPVYNEYWERKNQLIADKRTAMKFCSQNIDDMSDAEIVRYADMYVNFQKQESELLVEFNQKFKTVLPPKKVLKLYQTDYDFKTYLLQQIKKSGKK